jgi:hypothetical protein
MDIQAPEAYRNPNRLDQKRNSGHQIIFEMSSLETKERILKTV